MRAKSTNRFVSDDLCSCTATDCVDINGIDCVASTKLSLAKLRSALQDDAIESPELGQT